MTLEEKFSSLIKEELPGKVGAELKEVLIKAEQDAKQIVTLEKTIADDTIKLNKLYESEANLKTQLEQHKSLDTKLANLEVKERALEITVLKIQLEEANKRADMVQNFTAGLVRNVEFRRTLSDFKSYPGHIDQYGSQQYVNSSQNSEETKTMQ